MMLMVHVMVAVGLAAFGGFLSLPGVIVAFLIVHLFLRVSAHPGMRRYARRTELGASFLLWFAREVLVASWDVARVALRARGSHYPAVVRVRLQSGDPSMATAVGLLLTLTPGTLALDYLPAQDELIVHALDAQRASDVTSAVSAIEARLLAWRSGGMRGDAVSAREAKDE